jgi:metal-sulfur cluster biosynthetic enzyme
MELALDRWTETARSADDRRLEVWNAINSVADPCSIALAEPIGIADLGLLEAIRVTAEGSVEITLVPTSPHCLFVGLFEEEIEARVSALGWVRSVCVRLDEDGTIWDEERMTPTARMRLMRRRAAVAASFPGTEPHGAP